MELFQLDQPELDFGLYRVMHARAKEVTEFLERDLLPQVTSVFEQYRSGDTVNIQAELNEAINSAKELGADPDTLPKVKELKAKLDSGTVDVSRLESEVYDHLYTFFRRYYHEGDFLSRRVYKDGVYAIPYSGEEVKLHWANADQYYIKTDEYLKNYSIRLNPTDEKNPLRVHFRIRNASEGEHGNIKAQENADRRFVLCKNEFVTEEDGETGAELVIYFEYRQAELNDWGEAEKSGKKNPPTQKDLVSIAVKKIAECDLRPVQKWLKPLMAKAPTDKDRYRTILEKHLDRYTKRNTFDYFIHKNLGGFLRREIDFYIKNEVMHLDDVENETAPKVEQYISKIKAIRKVAGKLIDFLAQLEDFQKRLWLKKKFVVETNYCITLDKIPEEFYPEIAANEEQRKEWVKLFAIDEIKGDLVTPGYSEPLTASFLRENNRLPIDTRHFLPQFICNLISTIDDHDKLIDGRLFNSDNFQALKLIERVTSQSIKCIYIDPPYNTGQDDFLYKDNYQQSSWLTMMADRLRLAHMLLTENGAIGISIDQNEISSMLKLTDSVLGKENRAAIATVKRGSVTGHKAINKGVVNITEYLVLYAKDKSKWNPSRAFKPRERNERYNNFVTNREQPYTAWKIRPLLEAFAEFKGVEKNKLKKVLGSNFEKEIYLFVKENATSVVQLAYPDEDNVSQAAQEAIRKSRKDKENVLHFERSGVPDMYLLGGQRLLFYSDRLVEIDGEIVTAEPLSDIWDDILPNDLHNEGGVTLKKGKKPEKLVKRVYDVCCLPGDCTLDFFMGSGTAATTALKSELRFIGVEQNEYFDEKVLHRLKVLNLTRKKHENEKSFIIKYLRLESYEDALNNLESKRPAQAQLALESQQAQGESGFKEQYILKYMLDVETKGSQSLLNIQEFKDPTAYQMHIKRAGTDESKLVNVDLIETFNWLLGLTVDHIAAPQTFSTTFKRDEEKRLVLANQLKQVEGGNWWFRTVTGKDPEGRSVLVIWRKRPGGDEPEGIEQDNLVLNDWFRKLGFSTKDREFDLIYVNGSNNLENVRTADEKWKVRLIEEDFMHLMFDVEEV